MAPNDKNTEISRCHVHVVQHFLIWVSYQSQEEQRGDRRDGDGALHLHCAADDAVRLAVTACCSSEVNFMTYKYSLKEHHLMDTKRDM